MINLSPSEPVWLIPDNQISKRFKDSAAFVWELYQEVYDESTRTSAFNGLKVVFSGVDFFNIKLDKEKIEQIMSACCWKSKVDMAQINSAFAKLTSTNKSRLVNFYKVVFANLWVDRVFLAPLNLTMPIHVDEVLDELCLKKNIKSMILIRSISRNSSIQYSGKIDFESRERRASFWFRLLMSTSFYASKDVNENDCKSLIEASYGAGYRALRRYYTIDFLISVVDENPEKIKMIGDVLKVYNSYLDGLKLALAKKECNKPINRNGKSNKITKEKSHTPVGHETKRSIDIAKSIESAISYASGADSEGLESLVRKHFTSARMKPIFNLNVTAQNSNFYSRLPDKVQRFSMLINSVMRGAIKSKRLQNESQAFFVLNILLSYLTVYLPRFYLLRDGDLQEYPVILNDFNCSYFVTRDFVVLNGSVVFDKEPPVTVLKYISIMAGINEWTNETIYQRIHTLEYFFEHIERNSVVIPGSDKVNNTFTKACYPKLQRRAGTVKKPLPRAYFGTFLSMLYAIEYLAMHLNLMLLGKMPGLLDGELYQPSYIEMTSHHVWREVWGADKFLNIKLEMLNFSPVFYHEGKVHRLDFVPAFFTKTRYIVDDESLVLANPNYIRTAILMCETGIRQRHLIWLDKDRYDCALDRSSKSLLAPLFVNSDKAHGEWTAIVHRRVFEVLDRQRDWYEICDSEEYRKKIWYGGHKGSKFGKFMPLFRLPSNDPDRSGTFTNWTNNLIFPSLLLALQYFIRVKLKDSKCEDLVYISRSSKEVSRIACYKSDSLNKIPIGDLKSKHTPHALRASFVSEAIRFLPPSIIGTYMTGQTSELVMYYSVFDPDEMPSHQQILSNYLTENIHKISQGEAPHLADAVMKINSKLVRDIEEDPVKAINTHGLMSLTGVREDGNGIDALRAKRYTRLAFNSTHICPFDNTCPKEVIDSLGLSRPCALCPYAIRGVDHLYAISAEKDKCKEMMVGVLSKIQEYEKLKPCMRNTFEISKLDAEHDKFARECYALEAIEQQLYNMAKTGLHESFFMKEKEGFVSHVKKLNMTVDQHLIKRLIDVNNFPDATSPELDTKFAYMRMVLLMQKGDVREMLKLGHEGTPAAALTSQIRSMVSSGRLEVMDLFRIGDDNVPEEQLVKPVSVISKNIDLD